ncbi:prepilin peptidase, partial [Candidatus Pacearchaeota archaeon]|nr:prepilin peptidase [Candidatus Pacearchaeota archaeon]
MYEVIFLLSLAFVWILVASIYDLRKRIVFNWLSFSLIIFALGFRFFYSLFNENFALFYQGLIGLGIFFLLGNLLYYGRIFAGGDAKLMIALGAILPLSESFLINLKIFGLFFILFLFAGAIYGLSWSIYFTIKEKKKIRKEIKKQFTNLKTQMHLIMFLGLVLMVFGFYEILFLYLGIVIFLLPYLYV